MSDGYRLRLNPSYEFLGMTKNESQLDIATGRLISAIQKEWGAELGESNAEFSENVLDAAHDLRQAGSPKAIKELLQNRNVSQFLGELWVRRHPPVKVAIQSLEELL